MKTILYVILLAILSVMDAKSQQAIKINPLSSEEERVILHKGTELPFTGKYYSFNEPGVYTCKRCDAILFRSADKFDSECGWPSFDSQISGAVRQLPDADGQRTEIICTHCEAHLGHLFIGEKRTSKNQRYCVNSISLKFIPIKDMKTEKAYFAAGCFWGVEHHFSKAKGVVEATVGYMGGRTENPTYKEVCTNTTGHAEVIEVVYDPLQTSFEELAKLFFEIHDPTQINGQGPDIGEQYRSEIFYVNDYQKKTAEQLMQILYTKGYDVVTKLEPAPTFWKAEEYHQDYYEKNNKEPYCHIYTKRF